MPKSPSFEFGGEGGRPAVVVAVMLGFCDRLVKRLSLLLVKWSWWWRCGSFMKENDSKVVKRDVSDEDNCALERLFARCLSLRLRTPDR